MFGCLGKSPGERRLLGQIWHLAIFTFVRLGRRVALVLVALDGTAVHE